MSSDQFNCIGIGLCIVIALLCGVVYVLREIAGTLGYIAFLLDDDEPPDSDDAAEAWKNDHSE